MSTMKAIEQCGRWAHEMGKRLEDNPFDARVTSYHAAWIRGWYSYQIPEEAKRD